jgi:hypothetical protein
MAGDPPTRTTYNNGRCAQDNCTKLAKCSSSIVLSPGPVFGASRFSGPEPEGSFFSTSGGRLLRRILCKQEGNSKLQYLSPQMLRTDFLSYDHRISTKSHLCEHSRNVRISEAMHHIGGDSNISCIGGILRTYLRGVDRFYLAKALVFRQNTVHQKRNINICPFRTVSTPKKPRKNRIFPVNQSASNLKITGPSPVAGQKSS